MFILTRTEDYLEKGLGVDFYKLPRATVMRSLSQVRKSFVWMLKLFSERQVQNCTERIRLSVPSCWVRSFTHRGVSVGIKKFPDRVRFTRALLQSKDLSMWFCLPLCVWISGLGPSSVEIAPEKRSPRTAFPPGGKRSSKKAEQASLLRASRGSQPACV